MNVAVRESPRLQFHPRQARPSSAADAAADAIGPLIQVLSQLESLLESLSDEQYVRKPVGVISSGVAGHVRHCLDHIDALLDGIRAGRVDYDLRERGTPVERCRQTAVRALRERKARLADLPEPVADARLRLSTLLTEDGPPAELTTSVGRELAFVLSHTIHHNAIISIIAKTLGAAVPERMGYAPATLAHRKRQSCVR